MVNIGIQIHDIGKGDLPPKDGWYYIAVKDILNSGWMIHKVYWRSEKKCWQFDPKNNSTLFKPTSYWGEEWMTTYIEKGFEKLWGNK